VADREEPIHGRLFRIKDREFDGGIAMPSPGEIRVILSAPAAWFEAVVGVDSNDLGYYANKAAAEWKPRGGGEPEVFRSPSLKEGMAGIPVRVNLAARAIPAETDAVGEKSRFYQAEWTRRLGAGKSKMADGSEIRLADLPWVRWRSRRRSGCRFRTATKGGPSRELLREWMVSRQTRPIDQNRTEYTLAYSHPSANVTVRAVAGNTTTFRRGMDALFQEHG